MINPVINAMGKSSQLGISKGSNKINRMYRYGVERLYNEIFFNRKTCIKTKTTNLSRLIIILLLILFLPGLQRVLFFCEFVVHYINVFQFAEIY